jgi:superfamily I DNA and/or RNA helicase
MTLLKGRGLTAQQEPARASLWASLFLVVPVVSTTFASVSRMFGPLGRERIGWLLIDEAGQALPQAAVGAIWRARRTVAIGDPMQIPPVVTMTQRLIDAIMEHHDLDGDLWAAPRASVQILADRASWFGTEILREDGDLWVGSPLRVHRRCESPMFEISNRIAYDGLMVQATRTRPSGIGQVLGDSAWLHVEATPSGHWSPAEGERAAELFGQFLDAGLDAREIFFVTPFRLVQDRLRQVLKRVADDRGALESSWKWSRDNVGTIHVVQGKEAEAVVLVLGSPSEDAAGARRWAGGEPNLLNVAASRAKQRLYVIGHRGAWRDAGVFRTLSVELPDSGQEEDLA